MACGGRPVPVDLCVVEEWFRSGAELLTRLSPSVSCYRDVCNVYVIRRGDRAILIDVGSGAVLGWLGELGISGVDWVLMTHHHRDQAQGASRLRDALVAVPEVERPLFDDVEKHWRTASLHSHYDCASDWNALTTSIRVDRALADYDSISWRGLELVVLPTPGHTRGSVTYFVEVDGLRCAFSGDLLCAGGRVWTVHDFQWHYDRPDGIVAALQSLELLADREPDRLGPSHGPAVLSPRPAIARARAGLRRLHRLLRHGYAPEGARAHPEPGAVRYERLGDHLLAVRRGNADFYVLTSDDGASLFFDYGYPGWASVQGSKSRFQEHSIAELRRRFGVRPPEVVVPTHYHDDHVSGLGHLRATHGTRIWAHDAFAHILERPDRYRLPCLWRTPVPVDRRLRDGERVDWREHELTVHHLPGHTVHAGAVFLEVDGLRVAVTGDQILLDGRGRPRGGGPVYRNRVGLGDFRRGVEQIAAFGPDLVLTGHHGALRLDATALERVRRWSIELDRAWAGLAPFAAAPGFALDPDPVTVVPYRSVATPGEPLAFELIVRNHFDSTIEVRCRPALRRGWTAEPPVMSGRIDPHGRRAFEFTIRPSVEWNGDCTALAFDVELGSWRLGQAAECLVEGTATRGWPTSARGCASRAR